MPARVTLVHPDEAVVLADLYNRAWAGCVVALDRRLVDDQTASLEDVQAWLSGGFEIYKTSFEGQLVGAIRCSFPSTTCHIDRLAVDPDFRRRGLGLALVRAADEWFADVDTQRVTALVEGSRPEAQAFWSAAGFDWQDGMRRYVKTLHSIA